MIRSGALAFSSLSLLIVLSACAPRPEEQAAQTGSAEEERILAYVGDETVTMAEVERRAAGKLIQLEQERYATLRDTVEQIGVEKMMIREAAARGITPEELMQAEVHDKVGEPTEAEIRQYYERNRSKTGDRSYEDLYDLIISTIKTNRAAVRQAEFIRQLKQTAGFRVDLDPPRVEVEVASDDLVRGAADAPVTIIEYTDFQCPYCKRVHVAMERLLVEYGDKIRFVYRDYPLAELHPRAVPASEAARCAAEQDLFWDYYQHLMMMKGDLSDEDLTRRATEVGLDVDQFTSCFHEGRHSDIVQAQFDAALDLSVTSTPTFFINGRRIIGSKTYEELKAFIEEELDRFERGGNVGG